MENNIPTADELRSKAIPDKIKEKQKMGWEFLAQRLNYANKHGCNYEDVSCSYMKKTYCIDTQELIDGFEKQGYTVGLWKNSEGRVESITVRW